MRKAYVFISSSADARLERQRVSRLIEKLNVDFADVAKLEAVLWEDRIYSAHSGFQEQIRKSTSCDVVIAILRGRIGMPLSREFIDQLPPEERVFDQLPSPTGTVYEILTALAARRRGETLPEIFVFRYAHAPTLSLDAHDRAEVEQQWLQLQAFVAHVFMNPEGSFKGALEPFGSVDEFEVKAERALRQWLADNIPAAAKGEIWPIALKGSPFRGLAPFGAKHAEVFFGRRADLHRALRRLRRLAERGSPFLTIVGPSGAGKSSFVRASLIPNLVKAGVVEGVAAWRVVVMRPGDADGDAIANLAQRLYDGPQDLPPDELGRPSALPELRQSDSPRPEDLRELFQLFADNRQIDNRQVDGRRSDAARRAATAPISRALERIAEVEKRRTGSDAVGPARLLLVVDQLDEIFAGKTSNESRTAFAMILDALAATGDVWIVATLRADSLDAYLKSAFARPAKGSSTAATADSSEDAEPLLSIAPPGIADMVDVVRGPAAAAGLEWQRDLVSGQRLDDKILADVDRPDLLPLLQFVLQELFERRASIDGRPTLTWAAYQALGSLDGAIEASAKRALSKLDLRDAAALPRLLRTLVAYPRGGVERSGAGPILLRAPRSRIDGDPQLQKLADALIDARILISGHDEAGEARIALAHQRVLEAWGDARNIVDDNRTLLRARDAIDTAYEAWSESQGADRLIPAGSLLLEAERAADALKDELAPEQRRFVAASARAARRRQRLVATAAIIFAAVSVMAAISAYFFFDANLRAERNLAAAKRAIEGLDDFIWKANQGAQNKAGFTVGQVGASLAEIQATLDDLAAGAPDDLDLMAVGASNYANLVDAYRSLHSPKLAEAAARKGVALGERMAKLAPADARALKAQIMAAYKRADVRADAIDLPGAIADARLAQRLADDLVSRPAADKAARRLLWVATEKCGDALLAMKDADASPTFARARAIAEGLANDSGADPSHERDLEISIASQGRAAMLFGDISAGLAHAGEALAKARELSAAQPANSLFKRDEALAGLAEGLAHFANGDPAAARADFDAAVTIARRLGDDDPLDAQAKHDLLTILTTRAQVALDRDKTAARADLDEALKLARDFVTLDGGGARAKFDLASVLMRLALAFPDATGDADEARSLISGLDAQGLITDRDRAGMAQFEALMK